MVFDASVDLGLSEMPPETKLDHHSNKEGFKNVSSLVNSNESSYLVGTTSVYTCDWFNDCVQDVQGSDPKSAHLSSTCRY